jgi:regulator of sigma E protease
MLDWITGIAYLLVMLSVLVIVHEWGHFIVAKLCGMRVEEFALFFGKRLVSLGKRGDTEYNIRSLPFGGFVKIAGMDPDDISGGRPILDAIRDPKFDQAGGVADLIKRIDSESLAEIDPKNVSDSIRGLLHAAMDSRGQLTDEGRADLEVKQASPQVNDDERKLIQMVLLADSRANDPGLYSQKPIYQRALTIFAGPFMSLFFGYFLFCIMGMTFGLPSGKATNQVQVLQTGKARSAGVRTGDRIVAVNGVPTPNGDAVADNIHSHPGQPIALTIARGSETVDIRVTPQPTDMPKYDTKTRDPILDKAGKPIIIKQGLIGVIPMPTFERFGLVRSVTVGTRLTKDYVLQLATVLRSPKGIKENVGGPIAMGQMAVSTQRLGPAPMILMAATLSLGLGIMNLLPIPILDGGHLLLLLVEKVRRRRLSPREVYGAQMVGLAMLALLVGFVMINDLTRTLAGKGFQ